MIKKIFQIQNVKKWFLWIWIGIFFILYYFTAKASGVFCLHIDCIDFSKNGWENFVDIFKAPLSFLGFGIPIYGIIVTLYRSAQFNENMYEVKSQKFNTNFFQLLRVHQDIVNALDLEPSQTNKSLITGRDCFRTWYKQFETDYKNNVEARKHKGLERIKISFEAFFKTRQSDLDHYFKNFVGILNFIDKSTQEDKQFYTDIIRNQLSSNELLMLFYYGLSGKNNHFKILVENYHLFLDLPIADLYEKDDVSLYETNAYGKKEIHVIND